MTNEDNTIRERIESEIARRVSGSYQILGYHSPPTHVYLDSDNWILFSTIGLRRKRDAQQKAEEELEKPFVLVKWIRPHYRTPRWYVYWRARIYPVTPEGLEKASKDLEKSGDLKRLPQWDRRR